ncbi:LptF/LptG family permease [Sulfuricurvum sp.]|uniref:LptF/LptG family permease n=1 Tax=Sulfuricurvum sp. TaxID=2025608 RepID=UPI0019C8F7F0|nr:LptF/LptG family permease [Sulfuricurvum sp.]MBD3798995.1 LptF/LptG family permease [Campylobacterota bacterium]MBD3806394.1 LptF/LptG family permease [Sulfuricurvum sp.]
MDKLRRYLLSNLSILFFSIFLPLFAIASVIFMIKLATYTAVIQLNLLEMGKLYLFVLPELLFYTLPTAFVVGGALTLYRLSNDNEMVVVFSLGISPAFIAKVLAIPAFLLSVLLFVNFLVVTPYIKIISGNFLDHKKAEAKFNLTASEFGHNFGDWMLFINSSDETTHTFSDVVLFNKEMKGEILITAKKAKLINKNGALQLHLEQGEGYSHDNDILKSMVFKTANINDMLNTDPTVYRNTFDYWTNSERRDKKDKLLITNTLLSLFPPISIFLIIALGIVHARHQKRWIYLWLFLSIVGFYSATIIMQKWLGFHTIWVVATLWIIITYGFYRRLVGSRF